MATICVTVTRSAFELSEITTRLLISRELGASFDGVIRIKIGKRESSHPLELPIY